MGKYYYSTTEIRKRCKTKCKFTNRYVGSIDCRDGCEYHDGYGKDSDGKFVGCKILNEGIKKASEAKPG